MTYVDTGADGSPAPAEAPLPQPPDAALLVRLEEIQMILAAAGDRDAAADARDAMSDQRDRDLDLAEMLDVDGTYGDHWSERRAAAHDRSHARDDRAASREDRLALARILAEQDPGVHSL